MSYDLMILGRAVGDGLLAQRRLDGDTTVIAPEDHGQLQAIISQGKSAEGILRQAGEKGLRFLKRAYERAEVPYAG